MTAAQTSTMSTKLWVRLTAAAAPIAQHHQAQGCVARRVAVIATGAATTGSAGRARSLLTIGSAQAEAEAVCEALAVALSLDEPLAALLAGAEMPCAPLGVQSEPKHQPSIEPLSGLELSAPTW